MIGTVTSQARKDVIPVIEKQDAFLWYVCPYEGFEANPNVIYTGACPNQHLLPLFEHMLPAYGRRVYLTGANYIWGWEMNRLAREIVTEGGGEIVGERCLPIGDTGVERIIAEVAARRPNFILSNMLGPSNHAFLRAMRELGQRDPDFRPERCPVVSCDLTECELPEVGFGVADGQLAAASYFRQSREWRERCSQSASRGAVWLRPTGVDTFRLITRADTRMSSLARTPHHRGQVLDLLLELQEETGLAYLFISHDMAVIERMSRDVAVMRSGEIVEYGSRRQVFENPVRGLHEGPYAGRSRSYSATGRQRSPPRTATGMTVRGTATPAAAK